MSLVSTFALSSLELTRFFFAMVLLLFTAHSFGFLFYEAKLPRVIGEISGGLILGPTFLGYVAPDAENWVFGAFPSEGQLISVISYIGLVLLMFISGFEIQRAFSKEDRKIAISFLIGATVVPFVIGMLVPLVYNFSFGDRDWSWGFSHGITVSDWLHCFCDCRVLRRGSAGSA